MVPVPRLREPNAKQSFFFGHLAHLHHFLRAAPPADEADCAADRAQVFTSLTSRVASPSGRRPYLLLCLSRFGFDRWLCPQAVRSPGRPRATRSHRVTSEVVPRPIMPAERRPFCPCQAPPTATVCPSIQPRACRRADESPSRRPHIKHIAQVTRRAHSSRLRRLHRRDPARAELVGAA